MSVRFAPSPTGTFHLGNLRTAWISHVFSRALGLDWVVRFEDIDRPRVVPGAMREQLEDLGFLGMTPDRVVIQSERHERHESLFREAIANGKVYPCTCSRKELSQDLELIASAPHGDTPLYSGRCRQPRDRGEGVHPTLAWRFMNPDAPDGKQDFVIARTDADGKNFVPAYHWACAIDDFDGQHQLLVRASDLTQAARLQAQIYSWVAFQEKPARLYPAVFHTALVTLDDGGRLEKRTRGVTLKEILAAGVFREELLQKFEASFDRALIAQFAPGKIWGEGREVLHLGEMGF